jgi:large subunit ribosomal protein L15
MQLHQLKPTIKSRKKKRIGRGGKRGTYSGRGQKGQKSRAGRRIRPAERDLIQRLPKLRGFKFKPLKPKPVIINLSDLEKKIKGDVINRQTLLEAGLIRKSDKRIKILGNGEVKKAFKVEGLEISQSAKNKIEAAGGTIKIQNSKIKM